MNKCVVFIVKIFIFTFLLIVFLSYLFKNDKAISEDKNFFPLTTENYWIYLSTSVRYDSRSEQLIPKTSTFKKEIVEVTEIIRDKQHYTVALVKETILYSTDKEELKDTFYFIIKEDERRYYVTSRRNNEEIIKKIKEEKEPSGFLAQKARLFLDLPLYKCKTFGAKQDWHNKAVRAWCYFVESVEEIDARELEGVELPDMDIFKKYKVVYRTNPDYSITYFVPGIGEVEHIYIHNGSFIRRYVRLLEYKRR